MHKSSRFIVISCLSFVFSLCAVLVIYSQLPNLTSAFAQQHKRCPNVSFVENFIGRFIPKAAIVNCIQGDGNKVIFRDNKKKDIIAGVGGEFNENRRRLGIGSDKETGVTLGLVSQSNEKINHLAAAGFSESESWYRFPCDATGSSTFGWHLPGKSKPVCPKLTYKQTTLIGPAAKSHQTKNEDFKKLGSHKDPYSLEGANVNVRQYCSATASSGSSWGYYFTSNTRGEDVCQLAIKDCQQKTNSKNCLITNQGTWRDYDPEATKLNVLLQCSSRPEPYYRQGEGKDIYNLILELKEETKDATSCVLYIYNNDEVLVSPQTSKRTLIHTETTKDGFSIDGLIGEVEIVASRDSQQSKPVVTKLKAKERYHFFDKTDQGEINNLSLQERATIVNLPVVKAFLDPNNWNDDEIRSEIRQYREALRQFYQPPAVQVEEIEVDGVAIWKTTIDLSNSETIVTLVPKDIVEKAGGLERYVQNSNAAVVVSGTFRSDRNWTMKSEGRFIEGEASKGWSNYTVLGLKSGNQPEMTARVKLEESQWNQYWFALTGHPRLVSNKKPGITEVSPGSTLNQTGSVERAAIGFSSEAKKLYHVITKTGVSLDKLATVMKALGCNEAMNLEGGNGKVLAENGSLRVSGEVRAPLIVVYDAQYPAPDKIGKAWASFQLGKLP